MQSISGESLRHKYLSEEDAERLYKYTEIRPDPKSYCPTCFKEGVYTFEGEEYECDCQLQLQLLKHYTNAGIGLAYQRLDWDDFEGDPGALNMVEQFWKQRKLFFQKGLGLMFQGDYGTGKTMLQALLAKDLVKSGYSVYMTKATAMLDQFTSGWRSDEERVFFQKKVKGSQVLVLDDLGKEMRSTSNLAQSTFDDVLRSRVQEGKSTLVTTNLTSEEIDSGYGGAILSMLREISAFYRVEGADFREKSSKRTIQESLRGETRPIV